MNSSPRSKPRVLLIGWDAADWKVIQPLLDAGEMPNLARLIAGGMRGNIATLYPVLSPMLWTSIATGKRAFKHGVHGFSEPLPDGSGVRPISILSRQTKALWNILNQNGHRSIVAGWWPSHPAEPINGVMVSNHFTQPVGTPDQMPPLPAGTVHPASLAGSLAELRVNPMELTGEFLRMFVPEYEKVDQAKDKRLHTLAKVIAETMSLHAVATELLETQDWDFAGIYYAGLDHFGHGFMRYHPPRLPHVDEADFALYQHIIANAYRYHDAMLGMLLNFTDDNTTVILMSDHGFHPDEHRPEYIPAEPAGPAVEHRHFGILCMKGPALRSGEPILGASLLDICPTILTLFGLPPGKDMDGKVLLPVFKEPPRIEPIESWDTVPGDAGIHPPETRLDPVASAEAFKQLVELGYVAPPGPNVKDTVDECVRELKYNLARSYRDGNHCGEAAALAEELWTRWPQEHRFGTLLIDCLLPLRQVARRRVAIEELARRIEKYQAEAQAELAKREAERAKEKTDAVKGSDANRRTHFEERRLRELAHGRPLLLDWLLVTQELLENKRGAARQRLERLAASDAPGHGKQQRFANALVELGDLETAQELLEKALAGDTDNPILHAQLAEIHFKAGRYDAAIAAATESLSLLYFQPGVHALLGRALLEKQMFAEAEQELRVAVSQSPRNLIAHETLAKLYRQHLDRPDDAFAHEGRARSLRLELAARQTTESKTLAKESSPETARVTVSMSEPNDSAMPAPFAAAVDRSQIITVVSGLPRSGTSLMMQLLIAAGREALTDGKRSADTDNPLGYYEFEQVLDLAKDVSWIPQARGKVVKIVAQLLPHLPRSEHYHVIFMERNLGEVIASQRAMLERQGRRGAELDEQKLAETYVAQLTRLRKQIAARPELRLLSVNYNELLADTATIVPRLAEFLGPPFDRQRAGSAIRPDLRRQRQT
jgi:predicted AlkP superfamily phosphohydrolase/phosphomutase/tetratricopeptide (TPR) repeat protein